MMTQSARQLAHNELQPKKKHYVKLILLSAHFENLVRKFKHLHYVLECR